MRADLGAVSHIYAGADRRYAVFLALRHGADYRVLTDHRVLGNDAVHVNAKVYKNIGREEVEVALTFTKEILKAVYQYKGLLGKLQKLKGQQ